MKINDNVYFAKRPALKGKIVEIMPNGIIKVNFTDEDGILVKKGKMKKFEVGADDLIKYAKGSTVKGGITIHELENRLSEHTQVVDDKTLDSEEIHNWGADNVTEYKKAQNEIDKIKYKGKGWEIYGWYDVSSFDYWIIKQEEQNYIQITIKFKNETVKEEEVDEIADALDSALADADRITNKYNYNPSKFAKDSTVKGNYFSELEANFSSTRRGGVKNYSVDIDLENGEQLRGGDLDFKDGNDALFLYERVKQKGEYQHEKIEDIQLIVNFKNGDYETVDIPTYADGGYVEGGSADLSTKEKATMYVWIDSFLEKYSGDDNLSQSLDMYKEFAKKFKKNKEQTHDIIDSGWARSRGYYEKAQAIKKSANRYANGGNTTSGYNYSIGGL